MLSDSCVVNFFFHSGKRVQKCPDSLPNLPSVDGSDIRIYGTKEKVANSKISEYVWTGPKKGKCIPGNCFF